MDGKLLIEVTRDIPSGKIIEMDFELPQASEKDLEDSNINLTKNSIKKNIKNKKMENDTKMNDENEQPETKPEKDMEENEEQPEEKDKDMKTTKEGAAPEYESEERKKLLEEDENESNPKKKTDMALAEVISSNNDLRAENEALKTQIKDMLPIVNRMKQEYETKDVQDFNELKEVLVKEPYSVPEKTLEGKELTWLRDQKDFLDGLPMVQDFISKQPISHEDVPRMMDFEAKIEDPIDAIFNGAQTDFQKKHDFMEVDD